jgi:hypothetical protein
VTDAEGHVSGRTMPSSHDRFQLVSDFELLEGDVIVIALSFDRKRESVPGG